MIPRARALLGRLEPWQTATVTAVLMVSLIAACALAYWFDRSNRRKV